MWEGGWSWLRGRSCYGVALGCWGEHGPIPSARSFAEDEWGFPSERRQSSLPCKLLNHKGWSVQKCFLTRVICGATSALTQFSRREWWKWPCGRESRKEPRDRGEGFGDLQGMSSEVSCSWTSASLPRWGLTAPSSWIPAFGLMPVSLCLLDLTCSVGWSTQPWLSWSTKELVLPVLFSRTNAAEALEGNWCLVRLWGKGCVTWGVNVCKSFFSPTQGATRRNRASQLRS